MIDINYLYDKYTFILLLYKIFIQQKTSYVKIVLINVKIVLVR